MATNPEELLEVERFRLRDGDVPPPDLQATKRELAVENRKAWADAQVGVSAYQVAPVALSRARASCASGKGVRRRIRHETQVNVLAVLDEASGCTTKDRLEAARLGATITGLAKTTVDVKVSHVVRFASLRTLPVDADAARTALEGEVLKRTVIATGTADDAPT